MRFINPLTMLQQALLSQPGGAPVPQVPMNIPAQMNFPTVPMTAPSQQLTAPDPRVDTSYNPAPQYYGPMHQKIADYFNAGSMWRTQFPQYVNQLMFDPEKVAMHSGSTIRDVIAPKPNDAWRINWFPATPEGDATKAAVNQTGGLLQPAAIDTGVRAGQNDVGGA